jgi:hypothetical protein
MSSSGNRIQHVGDLSPNEPEEHGIIINRTNESDMDIIGGSGSPRLAAHNFDGNSLHQLALELKATGPDSLCGGDMIGQKIKCKYWYAHNVEIEDKDGQLINTPRVVLIAEDGTSVRFASAGVFDTLRMIVKYYGRKPFVPQMSCEIKQVKTRKGNKMLVLVPDLDVK